MGARSKDKSASTDKRRDKGTGSVYKDSRGLWTGVVELTPDPLTGKRRSKKVRRKDKGELIIELDRLRAQMAQGMDLSRDPTVETWMWYWFEKVNDSRPTSRRGIRTKIERYIIPAIGGKKLSQLQTHHVREMHDAIRARGLSPSTVLGAHATLQTALTAAMRERLATFNAAQAVGRPKLPATSQPALTVEQAVLFMRTVDEDRLAARWAMAFLVAARQGEVLGLELDRINWAKDEIDLSWQLQRLLWIHGCVPGEKDEPVCERTRGTDCPDRRLSKHEHHEYRHITGGLWFGRPKSAAGTRIIPMVGPLRNYLAARVDVAASEPNPHGLVFTAPGKQVRATDRIEPLDGRPIDPKADSVKWHAALERARLPKIKLHSARHTSITIMNNLEIPESVIIKIAGQSSVDMSRHYDQSHDDAPQRKALAAVGDLFS